MSIKFFFSIFLVLTFKLGLSQKITVEKIWSEYEFFGKSVNGFQSMNDGNYFSKTSAPNKVTKHEFSNYEGEGEVIISSDILYIYITK